MHACGWVLVFVGYGVGRSGCDIVRDVKANIISIVGCWWRNIKKLVGKEVR